MQNFLRLGSVQPPKLYVYLHFQTKIGPEIKQKFLRQGGTKPQISYLEI